MTIKDLLWSCDCNVSDQILGHLRYVENREPISMRYAIHMNISIWLTVGIVVQLSGNRLISN